jgi:hypothetical protein
MRRKTRPDSNQPEIVEALLRCGCEVEDMTRVGGGFTDLVVYRRATDRLVLMEIKTASGKVRKSQEDFAKRFPVVVVRTVAEALEAVGIKCDEASGVGIDCDNQLGLEFTH